MDTSYGSLRNYDSLKLYLLKSGSESYGFGVGVSADMQYWAGGPATGEHRWYTSHTERAKIDAAGIFTYNSLEVGYRDIPRVTGGIERGKVFATGASLTLNTGQAAGSAFSVYNDSAGAITITQGAGLTLRLAGTTTTGSRTLAARAFATIWYNSTSEAIVSGSGVS
jgi:hypothetical protein